MKDSMRSKLVGLCRRLEEIDAMLAAPDAADDMNRFRALSQERAEIEPVTVKMHAYEQTEGDIEAAQEMAKRRLEQAEEDDAYAKTSYYADLQRAKLYADTDKRMK